MALLGTNIGRRDFLKSTALTTAAVASVGLAGCAPQAEKLSDTGAGVEGVEGMNPHVVESDLAVLEEGAEWKTGACWHNCGGRCLNKVLVKDGVVIRQKTDDNHQDSADYPQQRACVRGRAQRRQIYGADRIKYPMKRKSWSPDNPNKEMRGKDEWERISWEEALDYVAGELSKAKEQYGNSSIFAEGSEIGRLLNVFGGYTSRWGTGSLGTWSLTPHLIGFDDGDTGTAINDRMDMRNCETIILSGVNPAWSSAGNPAYNYLQVKNAGAKFIAIDPYYNDSYALLDAEWIPCYPSQDVAIWLGVAYTLITEDSESNPMIDWDFLDRCTIGFDAEHMPEGEDPKGNFKDYVLGTYDGTPKTPEWASERCGVSPDDIRRIAQEIVPSKKVAILTAWAAGRTHAADNLPQMIMTIGSMTGHIGKSGHMCGISCHNKASNHGPAMVKAGKDGLPAIDPVVTDCINDTELWSAILEGSYNFTGTAPNKNKTGGKGEIRPIDIHVIYHAGRALLQTRDAMAKGIEAHRKVDFAVAHAQFLTTSAKYCDIILPLDTYWERPGGFLTGNREMVIVYSKVIEPQFECHSDQWIACELAKRLGIDPAEVYPFGEQQQFFNQLAGAEVLDADGKTYKPLVTITNEDIAAWGVEGEPQTGEIGLNELLDLGCYQVEHKPGDNYGYIAYEDFVKDPEANPREESPSGKFEIFSRNLSDTITGMGYSAVPPIPEYIEPVEGLEDTYSDFAAKTKGEYPYQVFNPHYLRRSHTVLDNNPWLTEAWPNPVYLSAADAAEKGIADGDTVLLTSQHGKTLRKAAVTQRLMPGVIALPHGSWLDMDEEAGVDKGGADNMLCGPVSMGAGISGWNSVIANMEKWTGDELIDDADKDLRVIC